MILTIKMFSLFHFYFSAYAANNVVYTYFMHFVAPYRPINPQGIGHDTPGK